MSDTVKLALSRLASSTAPTGLVTGTVGPYQVTLSTDGTDPVVTGIEAETAIMAGRFDLTLIDAQTLAQAGEPVIFDRRLNFSSSNRGLYMDAPNWGLPDAPSEGDQIWFQASWYFDGTNYSKSLFSLSDPTNDITYIVFQPHRVRFRDEITTDTSVSIPSGAARWSLCTWMLEFTASGISAHMWRDGEKIINGEGLSLDIADSISTGRLARMAVGYLAKETPGDYVTFPLGHAAYGTGDPAAYHSAVWNGGSWSDPKAYDFSADANAGAAVIDLFAGVEDGQPFDAANLDGNWSVQGSLGWQAGLVPFTGGSEGTVAIPSPDPDPDPAPTPDPDPEEPSDVATEVYLSPRYATEGTVLTLEAGRIGSVSPGSLTVNELTLDGADITGLLGTGGLAANAFRCADGEIRGSVTLGGETYPISGAALPYDRIKSLPKAQCEWADAADGRGWMAAIPKYTTAHPYAAGNGATYSSLADLKSAMYAIRDAGTENATIIVKDADWSGQTLTLSGDFRGLKVVTENLNGVVVGAIQPTDIYNGTYHGVEFIGFHCVGAITLYGDRLHAQYNKTRRINSRKGDYSRVVRNLGTTGGEWSLRERDHAVFEQNILWKPNHGGDALQVGELGRMDMRRNVGYENIAAQSPDHADFMQALGGVLSGCQEFNVIFQSDRGYADWENMNGGLFNANLAGIRDLCVQYNIVVDKSAGSAQGITLNKVQHNTVLQHNTSPRNAAYFDLGDDDCGVSRNNLSSANAGIRDSAQGDSLGDYTTGTVSYAGKTMASIATVYPTLAGEAASFIPTIDSVEPSAGYEFIGAGLYIQDLLKVENGEPPRATWKGQLVAENPDA